MAQQTLSTARRRPISTFGLHEVGGDEVHRNFDCLWRLLFSPEHAGDDPARHPVLRSRIACLWTTWANDPETRQDTAADLQLLARYVGCLRQRDGGVGARVSIQQPDTPHPWEQWRCGSG